MLSKMKIAQIVILSLSAISFLAFQSCTEPREDEPSQGSFEMLFTTPDGDEEILARAVEFIGSADKTIDIAAYGIDLTDFSDALIQAKNSGVLVRIAFEGDHLDAECYQELIEAGIACIPDNDEGAITHDKYMIIDTTFVWTGSTNFTYNCFYLNNNNVIIIESADVAKAYLEDFSQMFSGRFHNQKTGDGAERFPVADGSVEVWFTPQDSPEEMFITKIGNAEQSIEFCIFAYTLDEIADAMISAKNRGVVVRGIFDEGCISDSPTEYNRLHSAGIDVVADPCPYAFHHKFMVIDAAGDDPIVIAGSGNFSYAGTNENDENFVVVHSASVAQAYRNEFLRWW